MSHEIFRNITSYDQDTFTQVTKHYGYVSAAVYRLLGKKLIFVLGSELEGEKPWPPTATFSSDYTPRKGAGLPLGWIKPPFQTDTRKIWPKGVSFYFPAQEWSATKLIFVVRNAVGKRTKIGDLDGPLEALGAGVCASIDQGEMRQFVSEAHNLEQMERVTIDLQLMIDHELRTPLTSAVGFAELLLDPSQSKEQEQVKDYSKTILDESNKALRAVGKLTDLFKMHWSPEDNSKVIESIDMSEVCSEVFDIVKKDSEKWSVPIGTNNQLYISFRKPSDQRLLIKGHLPLIRNAIFEVVKNAVMYSGHGKVSMTLYQSEDSVVVDIEDDGVGVSQGAEELIFLRFFQGPLDRSMKKVKRGLGVGLYIARCISEQHGGSLRFIRGAGRSGLFRFILPLEVDVENQVSLTQTG
ncbi:MAG: HAMP domain-containing histidine kinase [Oligoflexales bacterium]|nr:HAMP domain-containing histidine kinase [Oligoflexales bacterium]